VKPHRARRRFGQNFLIDEAVVAAIVAAVDPRPDDRMVEIGPGLGALTRPLAARLARLHVVEIDRDIVARLHANAAPGLVIHEGDALAFDFAALGPGLRVVGNLPYNISTPLLFHLAACAASLRDIHVMLQKEVVERMLAAPGASDYGRTSVMLQYRFAMEGVLEVPGAAFRPAPEVESAFVRMIPHRPLPHPARDEARLEAVVAAAFAQRRKTLRNTLGRHFSSADFARLGIDPGLRAQNLDVAAFVRLADDAVARGKTF
jgi:16S rRNA (adenine1518-N6/adenine1519-N6)-dimethyltransferase